MPTTKALIRSTFNLQNKNTFALDANAQYFANPKTRQEILTAIDFANNNQLAIYPLGEGSNILLAKNINGLVLQNSMQAITQINATKDYEIWRVEAGHNWHELVKKTLAKNLFGLERLALIPGSLGAAPVQNIGAYGAEIKDVIETVEVLDANGRILELKNCDCNFAYRSSIFKSTREFLILAVTLKLSKKPNENLTDYGNLNLNSYKTSSQIAQKIIATRKAKLPDYKILPNVGSFFKNPLISDAVFANLNGAYADLVYYKIENSVQNSHNLKTKDLKTKDLKTEDLKKVDIKIPAAWLLEKAGFKGKMYGNLSMYEKQPLVMVKHRQTDLNEILEFTQFIKTKIKTDFDIDLETEPQQLMPIFPK